MISRYLAGKIEYTDIKEDRDLTFELIPNLEEKELHESYKTYYEQNKKVRNKTGIIFDRSFKIFEQTIKILVLVEEFLINLQNINAQRKRINSLFYL